MCGEERRGSPEAVARFRRRLADLKRNGCNVLLVGTDALEAACERLLGESGAGRRYRLFVTTDAGPGVARAKLAILGSGRDSDEATVVNWAADVRGAAANEREYWAGRGGERNGARNPNGPPLREVFVDGETLRDLGAAVEREIESFETESGGLTPAELRVCFDSLVPLVTDHPSEDVRAFLGELTEAVERVDGMAHYHLPAEPGSETVESLAPLFDAVIEVRRGREGVEQRWHLADSEFTTGWVAL